MVREDDHRFLKSLGTNAVRIPFGYRLFIDDQNPSCYLESGFATLERVIGYCRKHQLYAILDLHAAPGSQNNDWHSDNMTGQSLLWQYDYFQQQTCDLWREIASRYADDPWVVGYDVLNEPGYDMDADTLNGFYRRAISSIRQVDPNHIIFLEGSDFGRCFDLLEDPDDPQIAYAFHFYPFVLDEDVLDPPCRRKSGTRSSTSCSTSRSSLACASGGPCGAGNPATIFPWIRSPLPPA